MSRRKTTDNYLAFMLEEYFKTVESPPTKFALSVVRFIYWNKNDKNKKAIANGEVWGWAHRN